MSTLKNLVVLAGLGLSSLGAGAQEGTHKADPKQKEIAKTLGTENVDPDNTSSKLIADKTELEKAQPYADSTDVHYNNYTEVIATKKTGGEDSHGDDKGHHNPDRTIGGQHSGVRTNGKYENLSTSGIWRGSFPVKFGDKGIYKGLLSGHMISEIGFAIGQINGATVDDYEKIAHGLMSIGYHSDTGVGVTVGFLAKTSGILGQIPFGHHIGATHPNIVGKHLGSHGLGVDGECSRGANQDGKDMNIVGAGISSSHKLMTYDHHGEKISFFKNENGGMTVSMFYRLEGGGENKDGLIIPVAVEFKRDTMDHIHKKLEIAPWGQLTGDDMSVDIQGLFEGNKEHNLWGIYAELTLDLLKTHINDLKTQIQGYAGRGMTHENIDDKKEKLYQGAVGVEIKGPKVEVRIGGDVNLNNKKGGYLRGAADAKILLEPEKGENQKPKKY